MLTVLFTTLFFLFLVFSFFHSTGSMMCGVSNLFTALCQALRMLVLLDFTSAFNTFNLFHCDRSIDEMSG